MLSGPRKTLKAVTPYVPGKFVEDAQSESLCEIIKIASNENPFGPYENCLKAMQRELGRLNLYPDANFKELRQVIGEHHGLTAAHVAISHGAGQMLQTLGNCFIDEGDPVAIPSITYSLYTEISKIMGAVIVHVPMADGYKVDLKQVHQTVTEQTKLIWLANPNNPTGAVFDKDDLGKLLEALPSCAWVVLDEAYAAFADPQKLPDNIELIKDGKRLISVRTFSKAYGLAGARIGYALASPEMVALIDTVNEPFNANRVAIAGAIAAITEDQTSIAEAVASIKQDRTKTAAALSRMGLRQFPSQSNFIMFETPYPAETVFDRLLNRGVVVRPCGPWGLDRMIRVTIGTSEQMALFLTALENVMADLE